MVAVAPWGRSVTCRLTCELKPPVVSTLIGMLVLAPGGMVRLETLDVTLESEPAASVRVKFWVLVTPALVAVTITVDGPSGARCYGPRGGVEEVGRADNACRGAVRTVAPEVPVIVSR
jgi:hypothetical protein